MLYCENGIDLFEKQVVFRKWLHKHINSVDGNICLPISQDR